MRSSLPDSKPEDIAVSFLRSAEDSLTGTLSLVLRSSTSSEITRDRRGAK